MAETVWSLDWPDEFLKHYAYDEDLVMLGNLAECRQKSHPRLEFFDEDVALVPFRSEMDPSVDGVQAFLDQLQLSDQDGQTRTVHVPEGILAFWFGRDVRIDKDPHKLVFVDSCPHTWDGLENVYLITLDLETERWSQQGCAFLGEALVKAGLVPPDEAENWGNGECSLSLSEDGTELVFSSSANKLYPASVRLVWRGDRWGSSSASCGSSS